jgi:hypothetical protein
MISPFEKLNYIIAHPDTGHLLYGFMDHCSEGKNLTDAQIKQIDKFYETIISNNYKPRFRKKIPYQRYREIRMQKIKLWIEEFDRERLKWRERRNPTRDAQNARVELKKEQGKRKTFYGVFGRFGTKMNWYTSDIEKTILLKDIVDEDNNLVADHIWLNLTKGFRNLNCLEKGDWIKFDARIKAYKKGYVNFKKDQGMRYLDYTLSYPTRIEKV